MYLKAYEVEQGCFSSIIILLLCWPTEPNVFTSYKEMETSSELPSAQRDENSLRTLSIHSSRTTLWKEFWNGVIGRYFEDYHFKYRNINVSLYDACNCCCKTCFFVIGFKLMYLIRTIRHCTCLAKLYLEKKDKTEPVLSMN